VRNTAKLDEQGAGDTHLRHKDLLTVEEGPEEEM
jgi:hypothetical protein